MLQTDKYVRKPFYINAIQVTPELMRDIAEWCSGAVETTPKGDDYIRVRVHRPLYERQTKAFVGDWVLYSNNGYKVYTDKAFNATFEKAQSELSV